MGCSLFGARAPARLVCPRLLHIGRVAVKVPAQPSGTLFDDSGAAGQASAGRPVGRAGRGVQQSLCDVLGRCQPGRDCGAAEGQGAWSFDWQGRVEPGLCCASVKRRAVATRGLVAALDLRHYAAARVDCAPPVSRRLGAVGECVSAAVCAPQGRFQGNSRPYQAD